MLLQRPRRAVNWLFHHVQAMNMLSMHQFVRAAAQGLIRHVSRFFWRENPPPIRLVAARVREATRVTGLTASGLQALTLLQRSKEKKRGLQTSDSSPCWIALPAAFLESKLGLYSLTSWFTL